MYTNEKLHWIFWIWFLSFFCRFYTKIELWSIVLLLLFIENVQKWDTILESFTDITILFFFMVEKVFCSSNFFSFQLYQKCVQKLFWSHKCYFFVCFCFEVGNASTAGIDFFFTLNFINISFLFLQFFFLQKFCNNKCFFLFWQCVKLEMLLLQQQHKRKIITRDDGEKKLFE